MLPGGPSPPTPLPTRASRERGVGVRGSIGVVADGAVGGAGGPAVVDFEDLFAPGAGVLDDVEAVVEVAAFEVLDDGVGEVDEFAVGLFEGFARVLGVGQFTGVADEEADELNGVRGLAGGEGAEELEAEDLGDDGLDAAAVEDFEVEFAGFADEDAPGGAAAFGAHFVDGFGEVRVVEDAVARARGPGAALITCPFVLRCAFL